MWRREPILSASVIIPGDILDGYRLLHPIGRGGFGEVWLCQLVTTEEFRALKIIPAVDPEKLARELDAVKRYRLVVSNLHSPHLISIEHVNRAKEGLFYTMPLADGMATGEHPGDTPSINPQWEPKTLATLIREQKNAPSWFNAGEIVNIMQPLIHAVALLNDAGVVHRDIKPENILFINGRPCLGDVGLLTDDAAALSRRGTPGYSAPSWYVETGGKPDMWGLATTFYTLLTGNVPDKIGRAIFLYPPQGKESVDVDTWDHFHRIILRAMQGEASERFVQLADFEKALVEPESEPAPAHLKAWRKAVGILLIVFLVICASLWFSRPIKPTTKAAPSPNPTPQPVSATPVQTPSSVETAPPQPVRVFKSTGGELSLSPKEHGATEADQTTEMFRRLREAIENPDASSEEKDAQYKKLIIGSWDYLLHGSVFAVTTFLPDGTYKSFFSSKGKRTSEAGRWSFSEGMLVLFGIADGDALIHTIQVTRLEGNSLEGVFQMEGKGRDGGFQYGPNQGKSLHMMRKKE